MSVRDFIEDVKTGQSFVLQICYKRYVMAVSARLKSAVQDSTHRITNKANQIYNIRLLNRKVLQLYKIFSFSCIPKYFRKLFRSSVHYTKNAVYIRIAREVLRIYGFIDFYPNGAFPK